MNALNSLVKTLWVVLLAFIAIGWLLADRGHLRDELRQVRSENVELRMEMEQELGQWRSYAARLEQTLSQERQARQTAERLNQELRRQLEAAQRSLDAAGTPDGSPQTMNSTASKPQLPPANSDEGASPVVAQLATAKVPIKAMVGALLIFGLVALTAGGYALGRHSRRDLRDRNASYQPTAPQPLMLRPIRWSESIQQTPNGRLRERKDDTAGRDPVYRSWPWNL